MGIIYVNQLFAAALVLVPSLPITLAADLDDSGTAEQQYAVILKEYNSVAGGIRKATTDLERKAAVERMAGFAAKFVRLAEIHPMDYLPRLKGLGEDELASRIEALFERAAREYADVSFYSRTVGETAKAGLYEMRHLSVREVAPEVEGRDQNGT